MKLLIVMMLFLASIYAINISYPFDRYDIIFERDTVMCSVDDDCNHGVCENYTCKCNEGYISDDDDDACSYKQSSQKIAFLLEFLAGFFGLPGLGRIYLGYTGLGIFHLIISIGSIIAIIIAVVINCCFECASNSCSCCGKIMVDEANALSGSKDLAISGYICKCIGGITSLCVCSIMSCIYLLIVLTMLASIGWWLSDWIRILLGNLNDANGYPLNDDL